MASSQPILFTGATGSLGAVILEQLLANGNPVTAVLRSFASSKSYLEEKYAKQVATSQLRFVEIPDMTVPGVFHAAAKGASAIIHVATPLANENFLEAMIKPADQIIDTVLRAATASSTVKRVIVTGSIVAVFNFLHFMEGSRTYTEADFNDIGLDDAVKQFQLAYTYSKTSSERKAWEYMHQTPQSFDLVFLLAPSIYGRSIQSGFKATKEDLGGISAIYRELFDRDTLGFLFPYVMNIDDVAKTHIMSLDSSSVPGNERYLLYSHNVGADKIANAIRAKYPSLKARIPQPDEKVASSTLTKFDNSKANEVFGTDWSRWEEAVFAIVDDILRYEKEQSIAK